MPPLVIAHRTCPRDAAENSLDGIAKAAALGADTVEVDVRLSADGVPMLLHDRWLVRTTGWPLRLEWLRESRARQLRLFGGGRLPTFAESLAALGPNLNIAIDVKDPRAGEAVISEVRNQGMESRSLFWSQHESNVRVAATLAPDLEIALLRDTKTADQLARLLSDTIAFGARAISAHWSQVTPQLRERCNESGIKLYAWCKTQDVDAAKLALLHGVVTNWPTAARVAVEAA